VPEVDLRDFVGQHDAGAPEPETPRTFPKAARPSAGQRARPAGAPAAQPRSQPEAHPAPTAAPTPGKRVDLLGY